MKLLRSITKADYQEIEVEEQFMFFKWRRVYRLVDGVPFRYIKPNNYITLGLYSSLTIKPYFKIKL